MRWTKSLLLACLSLTTMGLLLAQAPSKNAAGHASASNSQAATADVNKGKKLFVANCAICHHPASTAKKIGPGLKGLSKRGAYAGGKPVDDVSLQMWIEKGGKNMPGFKDSLNAEQIRDLIAYLKTL